jgi:uncharacterized membrane protein
MSRAVGILFSFYFTTLMIILGTLNTLKWQQQQRQWQQAAAARDATHLEPLVRLLIYHTKLLLGLL